MQANISKSLLIGTSIALFAWSIYTLGAVTIPTSPASHDVYLYELYVGPTQTQQLKFDNATQKIIIDNGFIAGEVSSSSIDTASTHSTIAGGGENTIVSSKNATIGGGRKNNIKWDNSVIGAGRLNNINGGSNSFIGAGEKNTVTAGNASIAGGRNNQVSATYGVIVGGEKNVVAGTNSLAAGYNSNAKNQGTFVWSDKNLSEYGNSQFSSNKDNTFLIRSFNGMALNSAVVPAGINVNIEKSTKIGSESTCASGTIMSKNGCFYACDGKYWQTINLNFFWDAVSEQCVDATDVKIASETCRIGWISLRVDEKITAYSVWHSTNCAAAQKEITCQWNGTFSPSGYTYLSCLPGERR